MAAPLLDLDAAKREAQYPDGIGVRLSGETFQLPAELPADVFSPFLGEGLGLVELLRDVLGKQEPGSTTIRADVLSLLFARPNLPKEVTQAFQESLRILFGEEQYKRFVDQRPSFDDYGRLLRFLTRTYGVSLGESWGSLVSRASDGTTSKPTSPDGTDSTLATSGDAPATDAL